MIMFPSGLNAIARRAVGILWVAVASLLVGCGEQQSGTDVGGAKPKVSAAFDAAAMAGQTALEADRPDLALTHFQAGLKAAADFPENDPRVAFTWMQLGTAQAGAGDFAAAETSLKKALALGDAYRTDDLEFKGDLWFRLGDLYRRQRRADDADTWLQKARLALQKSATADLLKARIVRNQALVLLMLRGQAAQAQPLFQESLDLMATAGVTAGVEYCSLLNDAATCHLAQNRIEPAVELLARAAAAEQKDLSDHQVAAETRLLQGKVAFAQKDFAAAEALLQASFACFEKSAGVDAEPTFRVQRDLAEAQYFAGHKKEALAQYETYATRFLARTTTAQPGENPMFARVLTRLAGLYVQEQQLEPALQTLEKLQGFYEKYAGADSPVLAQLLKDKATLLRQMHRTADADAAEAQAQAILAKQPPPESP